MARSSSRRATGGGRAIVRELFLSNIGRIVTKEQILAAIRERTGVEDYENWHQRLSELRTDEGYTILAQRDRKDLRPGEYMMPNAERRPTAGKRVAPLTSTWDAVLRRSQNRCEWNEAGVSCGLENGEVDPVGGGTVKLTADHMRPHSIDPESDPADASQWQALCGRHQVTKRNYWDSTTGKLNVVAIVQAAPEREKRAILDFLLSYFGSNNPEKR